MTMHSRDTHGFTLVEMIISVGLFAVVMLVSIAALLALVDANRKAQSLQSVMNNLNITVDGMVRSLRKGEQYHCGLANYSAFSLTAQDCLSGDTFLAYRPYYDSVSPPAPVLYWFATDANGVGRLYKSEDGTQAGGLPVTSPDVSIDSVTFYVIGSSRTDNLQPKVLVVVRGTAGGGKLKTRSTFHIQASATQRVLDL